MKKILPILLLILISTKAAFPQSTAKLKIDTVNGNNLQANEIFNVGIKAEDIYNAGSIGLWILFDKNSLTYNGINSINPQISSNCTYNFDGTYIRIAWYNMSGTQVNLSENLLLNLQFKYKSGYSRISFHLPKCNIADYTTLKSIPVNYTDGWVKVKPSGFTLISPFNGTTSSSLPLFKWNIAANATYYKLYVDNTLIKDSITTTSYQLKSQNILSKGNHSWYIVACNPYDSRISNISNFTVTSSGKGLELLSPLNGEMHSTCSNIKFSWTTTDISGFPIKNYILNISGLQPIVLGGNDTTYTLPFKFAENTYDWYVEAIDSMDINITSGIKFFIIEVINGYTAEGNINYCNEESTALKNIKLLLKNSEGSIVDSTYSDDNGHFIFNELRNDVYTIVPNIDLPVKNVDIMDGLTINKVYVKLLTIDDPVVLEAADVNGDNMINMFDALTINRFYVKLIDELPAGNWFVSNTNFIIDCADTNISMKAICYGDVNANYR